MIDGEVGMMCLIVRQHWVAILREALGVAHCDRVPLVVVACGSMLRCPDLTALRCGVQ